MPTRRYNRNGVGALLFCLFLVGLCDTSTAEVIVHGDSTPLASDPATGSIIIPGDRAHPEGSNLFYSFSVFNVLGTASGEPSATFTPPSAPPPSIDNVISRVTGGVSTITGNQMSLINGAINSGLGGANFFFINPHGVMFGPEARLNVGGSFHVSTADYVKFGDGKMFFADPSRAVEFSVDAPSAFGFLNPAPAAVAVNAPLAVVRGLFPPTFSGATLSIVGGPIDIGAADGSAPPGILFAPRGRINLVSVASEGEATFDGKGFDTESFASLGDIRLQGESIVDASEIFVNGDSFTINNSIVVPGFLLQGSTLLAEGGEVNVKVRGEVDITGTGPTSFGAIPGILTFAGPFDATSETPQAPPDPDNPVNVPDITIVAQSLSVSDGAVVQSNRFGPGEAAEITIVADSVEVRNGAVISVNNLYEGDGGLLNITASHVALDGNANPGFTGIAANSNFNPFYLFTPPPPLDPAPPLVDPELTNADAGSIFVNATGPGSLVVSGGASITTDSFSLGRSGNITINASDIFLSRDGASSGQIAAQSFLAGRSGDVTINATGTIQVGEQFRISAITGGSGDGGVVSVSADQSIELSGTDAAIFGATAQPTDETLNPFAALFGAPSYAALEDNIALITGNPDANLIDVLTFFDGIGLLTFEKKTPGDGGTVQVKTQNLILQKGSRIDSSTVWDGNAGRVQADVGSLTVSSGSSIRSQSGLVAGSSTVVGSGQAGDVRISAERTITVTDADSVISTSTLGAGNAGQVFLSASEVQIVNGGEVSSESFGTGFAGDIVINADDRIVMNGGSISTRAVTSDGGNITLNAPILFDMLNAQVTTSVESGEGKGGNINIDPAAVVLQNSRIIADAFGGPGGNIRIVAGQFIVDQASIVSASSALGIDGNIEINAPDTNLTGKLVPLPKNFLDASQLLRDRCGAARGGTSSFSAKGRGGVPPGPDGYLPSYAMSGADHGGGGTASAGNESGAGKDHAAGGPLLAMAGMGCTW